MADITYFGQRDYSLRAWIDPDKLATLGLTAADVVAAIAAQNLQVAAGQIGQEPVPKGQQFQLTINTLGRLVDPEQFGDIIVKAGSAAAQATGRRQRRHPGSAGSDRTGSAELRRQRQQRGHQPLPPAIGIVRLRDVAQVVLGLAAIRTVLHAQRQAERGPLHLPASRFQRLGHGEAASMPR